MIDRLRPVGILVAVMFGVNIVGRLIAWKALSKDDHKILLGIVAFAGVALAAAVAGFLWARTRPVPRLVGDLGLAIGVGCLLSVLIGPFAEGSRPFKEGVELFVYEVLWFAGLAGFGAAVGVLIAMTFGLDWKSQGYKRYADSLTRRPRRP